MLSETTEWSLKLSVFDSIQRRFPNMNIDIFASHLNTKLSRYISWFPDKSATFCDAFSLNWSNLHSYAFPPFNLIGRVLQKVVLDHCELVIVVPEWPSQTWYSKLISMLLEPPLYLPRGEHCLQNPINQRAAPIKARFLACRIGAF